MKLLWTVLGGALLVVLLALVLTNVHAALAMQPQEPRSAVTAPTPCSGHGCPTRTATPTATQTYTPGPTNTPTNTPTVTPTFTPTATPTNTGTPTAVYKNPYVLVNCAQTPVALTALTPKSIWTPTANHHLIVVGAAIAVSTPAELSVAEAATPVLPYRMGTGSQEVSITLGDGGAWYAYTDPAQVVSQAGATMNACLIWGYNAGP